MVLFILIFFVIVITVGVMAVGGFSFYLKRRTRQLQSENPKRFIDDVPPHRSLFEPTDEEIRALEREESAKEAAKTADEARLSAAGKIEAVREFKKVWTNAPSKNNTLELFRRAAESADADVFSETAETVIDFHREKKIENLTANDLADLLDSHLGTLPQQERNSGVLFWIKREIVSLRGNSE